MVFEQHCSSTTLHMMQELISVLRGMDHTARQGSLLSARSSDDVPVRWGAGRARARANMQVLTIKLKQSSRAAAGHHKAKPAAAYIAYPAPFRCFPVHVLASCRADARRAWPSRECVMHNIMVGKKIEAPAGRVQGIMEVLCPQDR